MGEVIHLTRDRIQITIYTANQSFIWGRHASERQAANEQTVQVVQSVVKELGHWYFEVRTRSWATHCYEVVLRRGWWAPVVLVGHAVFSQGDVPDRIQLRNYLREQIHILRPRLAS